MHLHFLRTMNSFYIRALMISLLYHSFIESVLIFVPFAVVQQYQPAQQKIVKVHVADKIIVSQSVSALWHLQLDNPKELNRP